MHAFTKRSCTWKDFQHAASLQCKPRYHLATVVLYHVIVVSLLVDRGVLLTKLAGMGITKSSWKCRPQNSRFFLSKSVKKSVKPGVRVLRARSALASHSLVSDLLFDCSRVLACENIRFSSLFAPGDVRAKRPQRRRARRNGCFRRPRVYFNRQKYRLFCSLLEMDTELPIRQNTAG